MSFFTKNIVNTNRLVHCAVKRSLTRPSCQTLVRSRFYATSKEEKIRARDAVGPFTFKAAALFLGVGSGLLLYFQSEKSKVQTLREQKEVERKKPESFGKPKLGGQYTLTNAENEKPFGSDDLKGKFTLIYFGFTHCPDICPEELDKMAQVVDIAQKEFGKDSLVPVFITCDPKRDTPAIVKEYVKDFHQDLIGLTGTEEEIRTVAKLFRVYVSSPAVGDGDDYLVDHSIFFYLMDPQGKFLDCYGQNSEVENVVEGFKNHYKEYKQQQ